jgi:hypothetical protein
MALKGDRNIKLDEIGYFANTVMTRGGVASLVTGGSGIALDSSVAVVAYQANPSGSKSLGVLLDDVVNYDLTKQHINYGKSEVQIGSKVCLAQVGWVVTDLIIGTPAAGDPAYVGASGNFQNTQAGATVNKICGMFNSSKDEDGFARVSFQFPTI